MRRGLSVIAAAALLACPDDRPEPAEEGVGLREVGERGEVLAQVPGGEGNERREIVERGGPADAIVGEHGGLGEAASERARIDPRLACLREHAVDSEHAAYEAVVRALCAELHDLRGVSASVAVARDDRVVFSVAVGPRCRGREEPLRVGTASRIGSVTKLVTAALALALAERTGTSLDAPLSAELPELSPAPTLRQLLTHTAGLRDPDPGEMLAAGDAWPEVLQRHREASGVHAYANASFLLVGRWLERSRGRAYVELVAQEPALASVRELVRFEIDGGSTFVCGHRSGPAWDPSELASEPPLPAWALPAGGGLASAEDLARLPFALERTGTLPKMLATRVPSDLPSWDYGLGLRMRDDGDALVLAHSGNTGTHSAELQWSPKHRVSVAVLSSTPQAFKATLHAAFTAALADADVP